MRVVVVIGYLRQSECGFLYVGLGLTVGGLLWIGELQHAVVGELSVKRGQFAQN